LSHVTRW